MVLEKDTEILFFIYKTTRLKKPSWAINRVSCLKITDVSGTIPVPIIRASETLIMETEMVSETSVIFNQLTRLIAREDFELP
jgi:hypothetical protein